MTMPPSSTHRTLTLAMVAALQLLGPTASRAQPALIEPPALAEKVANKELPPIGKRVPAEPLRLALDGPDEGVGQHGGQLTQLMGRANDIRRMSAYGYTRIVCYDRSYRLVPDIVKSFDVQEGRVFTFVLRRGHRWSDGHPFTTEDFRYFWEDMALNQELYPGGPDKDMVIDGKPAKVEVIDPTTIRYTWDKPNPYFLPALASATPLVIYRPAHYLKRFHKRYAKADKLQEQITKRNRRDWIDLHFNRDRILRLDNPDFPSLDPWINTTAPPSERFIFERNPYYHHVDRDGRQLPYIDRIAVTIANPKLIPAKVGAGEVELQSRGLSFNNYTLLKRGEHRNGYKVRLWPQSRGSQVALYPNLNVSDPGWRELVRDVRFRRALSLAIDRREINQVIFFGLGRESANTLLPESPLYAPELARKWAGFDVRAANALLDELGLKVRDGRGIRLMKDGRPLEIIVETSGEEQEHSDVLELVRDSWAKAGVALFIKPQTREVLRKRVKSGATVMSVFYGLDNGIATAATEPHELAPIRDDQLQWPVWALHHVSSGKSGEAPDLPEVKALMANYRAWSRAETDEQRLAAWRAMLLINADQVFTIGTVNSVPQPVIVSDKLRNVPVKAIYSWDPGAHLGIFRPDAFWLAGSKEGS
jgi:peptide/nickel transport system substrate-binding protein